MHIDFVTLAPATGAEARSDILAQAAALAEIESVLEAGVIEAEAGSDFELALYFLLPRFSALEPFGTDGRYVRFLQGTVAPHLGTFAGADVHLEDDFDGPMASASCLALAAPPETYDWEIRGSLSAWAAGLSGSRVIGIAVG